MASPRSYLSRKTTQEYHSLSSDAMHLNLHAEAACGQHASPSDSCATSPDPALLKKPSELQLQDSSDGESSASPPEDDQPLVPRPKKKGFDRAGYRAEGD